MYVCAFISLFVYQKLAEGSTETGFYSAKVKTAQFYFKKILPRVRSHVDVIAVGLDSLMALDAEDFAF